MNSIEKAITKLTNEAKQSAQSSVVPQRVQSSAVDPQSRDSYVDIDFNAARKRRVISGDGAQNNHAHSNSARTDVVAVVEKLGDVADDRDAGNVRVELSGETESTPVGNTSTANRLVPLSGVRGNGEERRIELPLSLLKSRGMVTPDLPRSQVAEEYRSIKRPILSYLNKHMDDDSCNANVVMVTSCVEGEGKTFSAINLAMSIAMELEKTVLFVDTDVAKGSAGTLLGIENTHYGLIDLLADRNMNVGDAVWQTDVPNLRIVPAGKMHDHSTELLASDMMGNLVKEISRRHRDRVVIFDAAPLLMTNEASVLAEHVGQVAFVVAAESTTKDMVKDALSQLRGRAQVGLILNKSRKSTGRGYGYGYGYGHGYGDRERRGKSGTTGRDSSHAA